MHEMQTIVTDVRGVYPSVCQFVMQLKDCAAFAKLLWLLVSFRVLSK